MDDPAVMARWQKAATIQMGELSQRRTDARTVRQGRRDVQKNCRGFGRQFKMLKPAYSVYCYDESKDAWLRPAVIL